MPQSTTGARTGFAAILLILLSVRLSPDEGGVPLSEIPAANRLSPRPPNALVGSEFARRTATRSRRDWQHAALVEIERGNVPDFLRHFKSIELKHEPAAGGSISATIWVAPDYLAVGSNEDFLYVPLTYYSATAIATRFRCVLPTPKIVDAIYEQSPHQLRPIPLPAGPLMRSSLYLLKHQRLIDHQRADTPLGGLLSGHKKDIVLSNRLQRRSRRMAIYGWHRESGDPIQPLSIFHGAGYDDYSQAVRLVSEIVLINGRLGSIYEALRDPLVAPALSDEGVIHDPWGLMHPSMPTSRREP